MRAVGLLSAIASHGPAATGSGVPPSPATGGGAIAGMVHCLVRGDDAAYDTFTCTASDPSHSTTGVPITFNNPHNFTDVTKMVPGCNATGRLSPRLQCRLHSNTMSDQDVVMCKAQAAKEDWKCLKLDGGAGSGSECAYLCDHGRGRRSGYMCGYPETTGCSAPNITGSFDWKLSYAARQGCTPVGGVSFDPAAKDAATTGMIQGMFCPASMQRGAPSKVDSGAGALADKRAWGDCHTPQTVWAADDSGDPPYTPYAVEG